MKQFFFLEAETEILTQGRLTRTFYAATKHTKRTSVSFNKQPKNAKNYIYLLTNTTAHTYAHTLYNTSTYFSIQNCFFQIFIVLIVFYNFFSTLPLPCCILLFIVFYISTYLLMYECRCILLLKKNSCSSTFPCRLVC